MVKFSEWLDAELKKKEWTRADLARHSHVRESTISMVYSGNRNVGLKLAKAIAEALSLPPITVFRAAGITEQEPEYIPLLDEWTAVFYELTQEDQQEILEIARMKANKHKLPIKKTSRREAPARSALKGR
jgi:transcriptional regulator with XRE-family HTH domain